MLVAVTNEIEQTRRLPPTLLDRRHDVVPPVAAALIRRHRD
jgi:hypothetical protein